MFLNSKLFSASGEGHEAQRWMRRHMHLILCTAFLPSRVAFCAYVDTMWPTQCPREGDAKSTCRWPFWKLRVPLIIYSHFSGNWCQVGTGYRRGGLGSFNHCQEWNPGQLTDIYPLSSTDAVKIDLQNALTWGESSCISPKQPCKYSSEISNYSQWVNRNGNLSLFYARWLLEWRAKLGDPFYLRLRLLAHQDSFFILYLVLWFHGPSLCSSWPIPSFNKVYKTADDACGCPWPGAGS